MADDNQTELQRLTAQVEHQRQQVDRQQAQITQLTELLKIQSQLSREAEVSDVSQHLVPRKTTGLKLDQRNLPSYPRDPKPNNVRQWIESVEQFLEMMREDFDDWNKIDAIMVMQVLPNLFTDRPDVWSAWKNQCWKQGQMNWELLFEKARQLVARVDESLTQRLYDLEWPTSSKPEVVTDFVRVVVDMVESTDTPIQTAIPIFLQRAREACMVTATGSVGLRYDWARQTGNMDDFCNFVREVLAVGAKSQTVRWKRQQPQFCGNPSNRGQPPKTGPNKSGNSYWSNNQNKAPHYGKSGNRNKGTNPPVSTRQAIEPPSSQPVTHDGPSPDLIDLSDDDQGKLEAPVDVDNPPAQKTHFRHKLQIRFAPNKQQWIPTLWDMGADISIIDASLIPPHAKRVPFKAQLHFESGKHVITEAVETTIMLKQQQRRCRFAIVHMQQRTEAVIGTDWMSQNDFCFKGRKGNRLRNYNVHDEELCSVVTTMHEWRHYLLGAPHFELIPDHKNLEYFSSRRQLSKRHLCWSQELQDYNFDIHYVKGCTDNTTDLLSGPCDDDYTPTTMGYVLGKHELINKPTDSSTHNEMPPKSTDIQPATYLDQREEVSTAIPDPETNQLFIAAIQNTPRLRKVRDAVRDNLALPAWAVKHANCFSLHNGLLYFKTKRVVGDNSDLHAKLFAQYHDHPLSGGTRMPK